VYVCAVASRHGSHVFSVADASKNVGSILILSWRAKLRRRCGNVVETTERTARKQLAGAPHAARAVRDQPATRAMIDHPKASRFTTWSRATTPSLALVCSIVLNIVLAIYIADSVLGRETCAENVTNMPGLFEIIASAESRLPRQDADVLREIYRAKQSQLLSTQSAFIILMARTVTILGQAQLDTAALRAVVDDAREKQMQLNNIVLEIFLAASERFSPEARQQLVAQYKLH
jgi:uncharacterized membrane protein